MRTPEQIKQLKQVPIMDYLASKGYKATSKSGGYLMYFSPLRNESTPSFAVDPNKNTFYDHGDTDSKGNIIELVQKLERISFGEALKVVESMDFMKTKNYDEPVFFSSSSPTSTELKEYEILTVKDVQHPALIAYLKKRKISYGTALKYIKEVHYRNEKGKFFGVGYQNDNGGFALRSAMEKGRFNLGKVGAKTFLVPNSTSVTVFEGMFNFLSAVEYYGRQGHTAIVLNSASNLNKVMPILKQAKRVFIFLDLDAKQTGQKATNRIIDECKDAIVTDESGIYKDYNDFNDFWVNRS